MGRIVVSENISLDGVVQDPTGVEDLGRGDWFARIEEGDREEWFQALTAEAQGAEALLLGRRSYEYFVARFPSRGGALPDRLNRMPKYVVSTTLENPLAWSNSTVLKGEVVDEVSTLKQQVSGEIVVYASGRLVPTLIEHDLVDELRLMTYPLVVGAGRRLFGETSSMKPMRLLHARTVGQSLALLTYQSVRTA
ncbi:MAG TPA: dihydrofolate reductase family protein [Candidatus Dormibacteraeota bacterium]|jgi:dihydrofolate reductase|nr:dihydrofolate reductase family protein [Candidatus Dormibacteraeota bacterium]